MVRPYSYKVSAIKKTLPSKILDFCFTKQFFCMNAELQMSLVPVHLEVVQVMMDRIHLTARTRAAVTCLPILFPGRNTLSKF